MPVELQNFSIKVKAAIEEKAIQFLKEASAEVESAAKRNSRVATTRLKNSWDHTIDPGAKESKIGSPLQNAIWEEFGTGEYAAHGDGRKGGWYIPEEKLGDGAKAKMRRVEIKGKVFYFTRGKTPNHTLQRAYDSNKGKIIARARKIFKELG